MVGSLLGKWNKLKSNWQPQYLRYGCFPVQEKTVLLEGGQGANVNGNMFALAKELCTNPEFLGYKVFFTVTRQTRQKAKQRLAFYGCRGVETVVRHSKAYCKALATAKFLFNDNTFPPYFHKRNEQVYCNTWHGTPLKTLGLSNKETLHSLNNIQKNFLAADYALFPNAFTKQVFMKDYALEHLFSGQSLVANYPRNGVFYNGRLGQELKAKLGYEGKRLFAYMPTFREAGKKQLQTLTGLLEQWDSLLDDSQHLLINLHFVLAGQLDCNRFKHISYFPGEYETYDVLNACDGLVTDYSSVFFDYAVTGKPIVLFAYDKEEYLKNRGVYFAMEWLPFPVVSKVEEVVQRLQNPMPVPRKFIEAFCPNGGEDCAYQLLSTVLYSRGKGEEPTGKAPLYLVYVDRVQGMYLQGVEGLITQYPSYHFVLAYRGKPSEELLKFAKAHRTKVSLLGLVTAFQFTPWQRLLLSLEKTKPMRELKSFYQREAARLFGGLSPLEVLDLGCNHSLMAGVLNALNGVKYFGLHSKKLPVISHAKVTQKERNLKFIPRLFGEEEEAYAKHHPEELQELISSRCSFQPILPLYFNLGKRMICLSWFRLQTGSPVKAKAVTLRVGNTPLSFGCLGGIGAKRKQFGICWFSLKKETAWNLSAKNEVTASYQHRLGVTVSFPVTYCRLPKNQFLGLRGPLAVNKTNRNTGVFRQSLENKLMVYVRPLNGSDNMFQRLKQTVAFGVSLLWRTKKANNLVLLFEKNGEKYEESASVLYETLLDNGYTNAYFVLTESSSYWPRVAEKYRANVLKKYSFRHYLYFFKAKTFIGTEAVVHAIDLQTYNLLALRKVGSKNMNYVFLQHGVMYMVSLDSESRGMFDRKPLKGKYRVVVSSRAEANHFITLGGHLPEDLYITGLPKFDRNTHSPKADKIVIMPTWRPWEIARAHEDFTQTGYYKLLVSLYQQLPQALQEKAVILPHPLVSRQLDSLPESLKEKMMFHCSYDDILKETALLITDYSSIAYDAFYRGAQVIFDWSQKEECMKAYGPSTKLMLNEENVFGHVIDSHEQLREAVEKAYQLPQEEQHRQRYQTLVEFHDGNNTQRVMECLKKDGIL